MAIDQCRGMRVIRRQHHDRLAVLAGAYIRRGLALDGRLDGHSKLRTRGRRSRRDGTRKPAPDRRRSRPPPRSGRWWARRPGSAVLPRRRGVLARFLPLPPHPPTHPTRSCTPPPPSPPTPPPPPT